MPSSSAMIPLSSDTKICAPTTTPTAAVGVNMRTIGQLICRQKVAMRAASDGAPNADCMGIATASGSTAELAASMI